MFYQGLIGVLVIALVAVLGVSIVPSLAFSSVGFDRTGDIGVTDDSSGVVGLDVASSVTAGSQQKLVTVTNNLDKSADITVSLQDGSQGTLYYGGQSGDSVTATGVGQSDSVTIEINAQTSSGDWTSSDCSTEQQSATTNGWKVIFYCASYDSTSHETQYKYEVVPTGASDEMKDLSHIVFGFQNSYSPSITSSSPNTDESVQSDPVSGVYGLKFDQEVSKTGSGQIYTFTVSGDSSPSTQDHGLMVGAEDDDCDEDSDGETDDSDEEDDDNQCTPTVDLPGPSSSSGSSGSETLKFTVEADWPELTASLDRDTTVEPESTPTPTDTESDGDEEDEEDDGEEDSEDDEGEGEGNGGKGQGQGN